MFSFACQRAAQYTFPLIVCARTADGEVHSGIGAGILISDTHALTVAHNLSFAINGEQHRSRVVDYDQARSELLDADLASGSLKAKLRKLENKHEPQNLIREYSVVPLIEGQPQVGKMEIEGGADLALLELRGVPKKVAEHAATLQPPSDIHVGTSVMRLGYPFHEINATHNDQTQKFELPTDALPVPMFANEGMIAQELVIESPEGRRVKMIRTTSPGLRGQSGGPLVDRHGVVWGIQSTTAHLPLGFAPKVGNTEEHQFLNVGQAVHTEEIATLLRTHGVDATWATPLAPVQPSLGVPANPTGSSAVQGAPMEQDPPNGD